MSKIQILVGSVTGTAQEIAHEVAEELAAAGHEASINDQPTAADLLRDPEEILLFCTSNTGAGDLPGNLQPLYRQLITEYPAIAGQRYGLINLGDSSYMTFGDAGQQLDETLADLGAQRLGDALLLDASSGDEPQPIARAWTKQWVKLL